jgi:hypothetical protein
MVSFRGAFFEACTAYLQTENVDTAQTAPPAPLNRCRRHRLTDIVDIGEPTSTTSVLKKGELKKGS